MIRNFVWTAALLVGLAGCSGDDKPTTSTNNINSGTDTGIDLSTTNGNVTDAGATNGNTTGTTNQGDAGAQDAAADAEQDAEVDAPTGLPDGPSSERQSAKYLGDTAAENGYYEYLPPGYGDGTQRPLLVFWHGLGENGDGGMTTLPKVLNNGPPKLIKNNDWPSDRPFVVLSPQHAGGGCPSAVEIEKFMNFAVETYDVDPKRIYATGLSCGAIGLWSYLARDKGKVTVAAVPIAGNGKGPYNNAGCDLALTAIWGFHGDADGTVDVSGTTVPIDAILADCPMPPRQEVKKTIYPGVGHNSWGRTYDLSAGHDIYAWLLSFQKP